MDSVEPHEHDALVRNCARRIALELRLSSVEMGDLVSYGYVGLLQAERRFDAAHGVKFEVFAYSRVRGAILDGVRQMARLTPRVHATCKRLALMDSASAEAGEARAERDQEADALAMVGAIDALMGQLAVSYVVTSAADVELSERPEDANIRRLDEQRLPNAMDALPKLERRVVEAIYFEDESIADVAEALRISKSSAGRAHLQALERLRERLV